MTIHIVPTDFQTVQAAIDAANAGDSIQILAGTFDGFNVTKERLKIFGCGIGKTIIAGLPAMGSNDGIVVSAEQTILQDFTVQGFDGDGVVLRSNNNVITKIESKFNPQSGFQMSYNNNLISNCLSSFNREGFDFEDTHNCIIHCESNQNIGDGIEVDENFNKMLLNTVTESKSAGIDLCGVSFNIVFGNKSIKNNEQGVFIQNDNIGDNSNNNNVIGNLVCNNIGSGIEVESNNIQNVIDSNIVRNNGTDDTTAGILIQDGAMENVIRFNKAKNNMIVDILAEGGVGTNIYDGNKCENSDPNALCT
ncbi:right-handed parallel beta-helix repeat-containing protein [Bacillus solimangrovi]|uniref:Right handed beta helix domain-containing protein n=1 Tax=Bacillus solimangrovi TaxID=1305675 RepID=A0A1E5LAP3_9BACI|nr:right-handed parallel beta-helix repeat-containing protein [Bacillus solimangrovi]OEH91133.1 hypothetical protein BFG57_07110 [Bacillus solimangrovi]